MNEKIVLPTVLSITRRSTFELQKPPLLLRRKSAVDIELLTFTFGSRHNKDWQQTSPWMNSHRCLFVSHRWFYQIRLRFKNWLQRYVSHLKNHPRSMEAMLRRFQTNGIRAGEMWRFKNQPVYKIFNPNYTRQLLRRILHSKTWQKLCHSFLIPLWSDRGSFKTIQLDTKVTFIYIENHTVVLSTHLHNKLWLEENFLLERDSLFI